jgi:hypothetical protein
MEPGRPHHRTFGDATSVVPVAASRSIAAARSRGSTVSISTAEEEDPAGTNIMVLTRR